MSVKLRFSKGALIVEAVLKDDALASLLTLVQEQQADEPGAFTFDLFPTQSTPPAATAPIDAEKASKAWLAQHGAAEVLNKLKWDTHADKILALGAFHESKAGDGFDSWRSADIFARFAEAKDALPGNFPRDIAAAIKNGMVTTKTPRTYVISRTGWQKISDAISKLPPT